MNDEIVLHKKINFLQAQMLDFNKRISPVKTESMNNIPSSECNSLMKFQLMYFQVATTVLKIFLCFIGPLIFPTVVYLVEGNSRLFWIVMGISSFILLLLINMASSMMQNLIESVKASLKEINQAYIQRIIHKHPVHISPYALILLTAAIVFSILTYKKNILILFYISLVSAGFLLGILTAQTCEQFKSSCQLPQHNSCNIKFNLIKASPRKGYSSNNSEVSGSTLDYSVAQRQLDFSGIQYAKPKIPVTPPPTYQEAINTSPTLPIMNLSYLFRTL